MTTSFGAEAKRRVAESVAAWDVYLETIAQMTDPRHSPPLAVNGAWAKGGQSGPTVNAKDPASARAELEKLAFTCTYSFTSLRADDGTSVTVFVWLESRSLSVSIRGRQEARVEGLRAASQRFLDRFPDEPFVPRIEVNGVVLGAPQRAPVQSRGARFVRALGTHTTAIVIGLVVTVGGGVLLVIVLRELGLP